MWQCRHSGTRRHTAAQARSLHAMIVPLPPSGSCLLLSEHLLVNLVRFQNFKNATSGTYSFISICLSNLQSPTLKSVALSTWPSSTPLVQEAKKASVLHTQSTRRLSRQPQQKTCHYSFCHYKFNYL